MEETGCEILQRLISSETVQIWYYMGNLKSMYPLIATKNTCFILGNKVDLSVQVIEGSIRQYVCNHMCACMHTQICMHAHTHVHMHVCMYIYAYRHTHIHTHSCMHAHAYMHTFSLCHSCAQIHTNTHTHTHTHTYTHIPQRERERQERSVQVSVLPFRLYNHVAFSQGLLIRGLS